MYAHNTLTKVALKKEKNIVIKTFNCHNIINCLKLKLVPFKIYYITTPHIKIHTKTLNNLIICHIQ
jgi:hypothetical protein